MRNNYYLLSLLIAVAGFLAWDAAAQPAAAARAEIDTKKSDALVSKLENISDSEWDALYKEFTQNADQYQPFAMYAMAHALLKRGKKGESAYWYAIGRIRAGYDAARADFSARRGLEVLEIKYPELSINLKCKYERIHDGFMLALQWDEKNPYNYDPRWVTLLSGGTGGELAQPESVWPQIRKNSRNEVLMMLRSVEGKGKGGWETAQRSSAQKGLADYEAMRKRAKEKNDAQLEKILERQGRIKAALEACLQEK